METNSAPEVEPLEDVDNGSKSDGADNASKSNEAGSSRDPPVLGKDDAEVWKPVKFTTQYISLADGGMRNASPDDDNQTPSQEPPVMEYVEVRYTQAPLKQPTYFPGLNGYKHQNQHTKGHRYITLISPAVNEALRCVVDYYPSVNLSAATIKIMEPFAVFVFFEQELNEYRARLLDGAPGENCANRYAYKHIGIVQDFVRSFNQKDVDAERERHARGVATFDMLWLLHKPGSDVYYDRETVGEHNPYVVASFEPGFRNGTISDYQAFYWHISAQGSFAGPMECQRTIGRFAGEMEIVKLSSYPCEYLRFAKGVTVEDVDQVREYFIARGKKWYNLWRTRQHFDFDGQTTSFPRRKYRGLAMVDVHTYQHSWEKMPVDAVGGRPDRTFLENAAHVSSPFHICSCDRCQTLIYQHAVKPRFLGYSKVNIVFVEELTDHQYFICTYGVLAFLFKSRSWQRLHVDGFRAPSFDKTLFEHLVMKDSTKEMIRNLTEMYIRGSAGKALVTDEEEYINVATVHRRTKPKPEQEITWSADFVNGKGEGLIFLLHGKPGVGKTYTAECIADYTARPLLTLTCADIGVVPETIEENLFKWFKAAQAWGAIVLIDEADIYMEERQAQDLERNHLVAGFLRALEFFKGILFLTTNRVGTFDEAFFSRIHVPIYYTTFGEEERIKVWDRFFDKLEEDRETTMRILQSTKDYVQSNELQALNWNGREIRNAFQVAVALAEAQGHKDKQGRVLIKPDHIKATVSMSGDFKHYLVHVHRGAPEKKAAMMGLRYDAYGMEQPNAVSSSGAGEKY
ncbi:hypothetical protein QBC44DRAFT_331227 [Cladorrhinum sp. PSN332]|nr:hypothetical protein QBC44DRAFT_331227 [Cladorrhinum sp. PSN332]